jgi:hypothetical protein
VRGVGERFAPKPILLDGPVESEAGSGPHPFLKALESLFSPRYAASAMFSDTLRTASERQFLLALIVLGLISCFARVTLAAVINVPGDAPTVQAGINVASNGDVVQVSPGTYRENINFNGKAISVVSTGGSSVTIINGGAAGPVVTFSSGETAQAMLSGFTITNGQNSTGTGNGGGISINRASPTIVGNIVTGNVACSGGGGIAAFGSPLFSQIPFQITPSSRDAMEGMVAE